MTHLRLQNLVSMGKTPRYLVVSVHNESRLGEIKYYPHWRKFVFHSYPGTLYDPDCLNELAELVSNTKKEYDSTRSRSASNG